MHCGINVSIEKGKIIKITGLETHPQNRGKLCPKGLAAIDTVYHPERLLKPLKKTASGSFIEITLDQAMEEIASRIVEIKDKYGARSVACWQGEALGYDQQVRYARRFLRAFGSPNIFCSGSVCSLSRELAYRMVQGYWDSCPDFRNANVIIIWGANLPVSHFIFMEPINEARKNGAKLIVIDPRLTEIAKQADMHLKPLPGTDGALAWGLIRSLVKNGDYDHNFVEHYSIGFKDFAAYSERFNPKFVGQKTGLRKQEIEDCFQLLRRNLPQVTNYPGVSLEHQDNGVNNIRTIACLGGLCGAVDWKGGARARAPFKILIQTNTEICARAQT
jgi:anaerobic selenocysteine-containing dehydrogenase